MPGRPAGHRRARPDAALRGWRRSPVAEAPRPVPRLARTRSRAGSTTTRSPSCEAAASAAKGTRSRSTPELQTTRRSPSGPSPSATHGTGSLRFVRGTGGATGRTEFRPTSDGSATILHRTKRSAARRLSGCWGASTVRCRATVSTMRASDSTAGTSPCSIWNASRSWAPTPTSSRVVAVWGSSTTRHTSRPRTSPTSTPCSTEGSAPPSTISRRNGS